MKSQRKLFLFSGYVLAFASLAPLAPLGGCGGDDSGAAADSGTDSPFETQPDTGSRADVSSNPDTGGGQTTDGSVEAAADTGTPQGVDAAGEDSGVSVPTGAIAIWHFDEGSGTSAFDSSGNLHTATLVNGATFAAGKHGTGLSPNTVGWAVVPASSPDSGTEDAGADAAPDAGADAGADAAADDSGTATDASDAGTTDAGDDGGSVDAAGADASSDADLSDADLSDAPADAEVASSDAGDASGDSGATFAPLVFDTTKSFSIGCWVKVYSQGAGQWQSAFSRSGENLAVFTLKLRGDSPAPGGGEDFDFDFPGADNTSTGIYTVAQSTTSPTVSPANGSASYWYHLVGVLTVQPAAAGGTTVAIYVNGAVQASVPPGTAPILEAVGDTVIGASLFGSIGASWNGVIDEVYLYDRALSAADVAALYDATK